MNCRDSIIKNVGVWAMIMGLSLISCGFPLSGDKYRVENLESKQVLMKLYAQKNEECEEAISHSCMTELEECASMEGCTELAVCRFQTRHPGGSGLCPENDEALIVAYRNMQRCVITRTVECNFGNDFSCALNYVPPRPKKNLIHISQTLLLVDGNTAAADTRVDICSLNPRCTEPLATATTNEQGYFEVQVPIRQEPLSMAGWSGFRQLTSDVIGSVRLQSNLPVWDDQSSVTSLLRRSEIEDIANFLNIKRRETIFVQAFDCQSIGAEGIVFEIEGMNNPTISYTKSRTVGKKGGDATSAEMEGAAVIFNLEPERTYHITARRKTDEMFVGDAVVYIEKDQQVYLSLYPNYKGEP